MKTTLLGAALLAAASSHAFAADAVTQSGGFVDAGSPFAIYLKGFGGVTFNGDYESDGLIGGAPQSVDVNLDAGYIIGGAIGASLDYARFGNVTPRVELELSYSESDAGETFFSGNGPAAEINVDGDIKTLNVFANALFDIDTGTKITPYVGGGIGFGRTDFDVVYGPGVRLTDSDTGFAAQAIVGASYALTETLALDLDLRYARTFSVDSPRLNPAGGLTGVVNGDVDTFAITTGLRIKF